MGPSETWKNNKTIIIRLAEPGDVLGLNAVVSNRQYGATAEMMASGQVDFIAQDSLLRLMKTNDHFAVAVAEHLSASHDDNLVLLNAILYVAEHGCKWRGLPRRFSQLVPYLCAHESLGQEGYVGSGVRKIATKADSAAQDRSLQFGLDVGKGTPRRDGG